MPACVPKMVVFQVLRGSALLRSFAPFCALLRSFARWYPLEIPDRGALNSTKVPEGGDSGTLKVGMPMTECRTG